MGGLTLFEEQMGQWGERKVVEQEGREEELGLVCKKKNHKK